MRWTERQQGLLQAMGLTLWLPPEPAVAQPMPAGPPAAAAPAGPPAAQPTAAPPRPAAPSEVAAAPPRIAAAADRVPADPAAEPGRAARAPVAPIGMRAPAPAPAGAGAGLTVARRADDGPVSRLDWPALAEAVAACQACGLCQTRRQTVFGVGHRQARCMVVGEAPGEQEDLQGEPFVGASGQLLDRMLQAVGLTRGEADAARQVFIANTLKCRPPGNRNPSAEELASCAPFLERQVALVQPRVILAMGRFAVQALLGTQEPLGKLRGRVHQWQGVPLVVTYHPAYLLRQPADKGRAWADLCLAASLLDAPAA